MSTIKKVIYGEKYKNVALDQHIKKLIAKKEKGIIAYLKLHEGATLKDVETFIETKRNEIKKISDELLDPKIDNKEFKIRLIDNKLEVVGLRILRSNVANKKFHLAERQTLEQQKEAYILAQDIEMLESAK